MRALRGLRANVLECQCGSHANVFMCMRRLGVTVPAWQVLKTCQPLIFTYQHANKRVNAREGMPMFQLGVPTCKKVCQFFNFVSQRTKRHANFWKIFLLKCSGRFLYHSYTCHMNAIILQDCIIRHIYTHAILKKSV